MILKLLVFAFLLLPIFFSFLLYLWDDFYSWCCHEFFLADHEEGNNQSDKMNNGGDSNA